MIVQYGSCYLQARPKGKKNNLNQCCNKQMCQAHLEHFAVLRLLSIISCCQSLRLML